MSGFLDLLNPKKAFERSIDTIKAPFESRKDHPWAQSTARNLGHAAFGDKIGDWVDNNLLGDFNGYRQPQNNSAGLSLSIPPLSDQTSNLGSLQQRNTKQPIDPEVLLRMIIKQQTLS